MGEMAALVEQLLAAAGFTTERFAVPAAPTIIFGKRKGRSPYTLLLYNHYDVQPQELFELWDSPPFEPTIRDDKLFARGASDNKSEIAARLSAIHALLATEGELPITLKWIIEGEEEVGSPHFEDIIAPHKQRLTADACLWEGAGFDVQGRPELGLGSKGLLYVQLDVQCLSRDAHSGGAPVLPSAAWWLVQALATLKDASGRITIPGFHDAVRPPSGWWRGWRRRSGGIWPPLRSRSRASVPRSRRSPAARCRCWARSSARSGCRGFPRRATPPITATWRIRPTSTFAWRTSRAPCASTAICSRSWGHRAFPHTHLHPFGRHLEGWRCVSRPVPGCVQGTPLRGLRAFSMPSRRHALGLS